MTSARLYSLYPGAPAWLLPAVLAAGVVALAARSRRVPPPTCTLTADERVSITNVIGATESEIRGDSDWTREDIVGRLVRLADYAERSGCLAEGDALRKKADRIAQAPADADPA